MTNKIFKNIPDILLILFSLFLFVYIAFRAFYVPPFSDEVFTFFTYIQTGGFQPFYSHLDANNHVLNSLFAHLSYLIFGDHIFFLRLPNVVVFLFYAFFVWKLKAKFRSKFVGFLWVISMLSAVYLLDFFNLCRGYGMSMAFLMGACFHLINYQSDKKHTSLFWSLFFISMSLWANLSLMVPVLVFGILCLFLLVRNITKKQELLKTVIQCLMFCSLFVGPLIYAILYSLELKSVGMLYHGRTGDLLNTTVASMISEFAEPFRINQYFFYAWFVLYLILGTIGLITKRINTEFILFHLLFGGVIIGLVFLNIAVGVAYPLDRTALYLFPLMMLSFFFVIQSFNEKIIAGLALIPSLFFLIQFIFVFNFRYTQHWKPEAIPKSYYDYMKEYSKSAGVLPTISTSFLQKSAFSWYDFQDNGALNSAQDNGFPNNLADFIITNHWDVKAPIPDYDTIYYDNDTRVALLQSHRKKDWVEIENYSISMVPMRDQNILFVRIPAKTYVGAAFLFDIEFTSQSIQNPLKWFLVCDVLDSVNTNLHSEAIDLQRVASDVRKPATIHRRQFINMIPENSHLICFYIWNLANKPISITDIRLRTYRLSDKSHL